MFNRQPLQVRLLASIAAIVVAFAVLAIYLVLGMAQTQDELEGMYYTDLALTTEALEVQVLLGDLDGEYSRAVYNADPEVRATARAAFDELAAAGRQEIADIEQIGLDANEQALYDRFVVEYDELVASMRHGMDLAAGGDVDAAASYDAQVVDEWQDAAGIMGDLVADIDAAAASRYQTAASSYTTRRTTSIAASLPGAVRVLPPSGGR